MNVILLQLKLNITVAQSSQSNLVNTSEWLHPNHRPLEEHQVLKLI